MKINFITGGVSSGKSRWAATYFQACDNVLYLCTSDKMDDELAERIKWANEHNFVEWVIETSASPSSAEADKHKFIIFDDLATYTSKYINALGLSADQMTREKKVEVTSLIVDEMEDLISKVQINGSNLTIISSEVSFSVMPQDTEQKYFRDVLGSVNQRIANSSTDVYMSVSGIQFKIK